MEKCYDFFDCDQRKCVMHGSKREIKCWEVEGTSCEHPGMEFFKRKGIDKCKYCSYLRENVHEGYVLGRHTS